MGASDEEDIPRPMWASITFYVARYWRRLWARWTVRLVAVPLLTALPSGFALSYYRNPELRSACNAVPALQSMMSAHAGTILVLALLWTPLFTALVVQLTEVSNSYVPADAATLHFLLGCIGDVVGHKAHRFGELAKDISSGRRKLNRALIFSEITQPAQQIQELTRAVLVFFSSLEPDKSIKFRVSLVEVRNGAPDSFVAFFPKDMGPRSPIAQLRDADSAVSTALARKKLHIVEDIRKEGTKSKGKRSFKVTDESREDEEGSMFSYPVWHPGLREYVYVISVCANQKGYFSARKAELYEFAMHCIADRICLEHSLKILRGDIEKELMQ